MVSVAGTEDDHIVSEKCGGRDGENITEKVRINTEALVSAPVWILLIRPI